MMTGTVAPVQGCWGAGRWTVLPADDPPAPSAISLCVIPPCVRSTRPGRRRHPGSRGGEPILQNAPSPSEARHGVTSDSPGSTVLGSGICNQTKFLPPPPLGWVRETAVASCGCRGSAVPIPGEPRMDAACASAWRWLRWVIAITWSCGAPAMPAGLGTSSYPAGSLTTARLGVTRAA